MAARWLVTTCQIITNRNKTGHQVGSQCYKASNDCTNDYYRSKAAGRALWEQRLQGLLCPLNHR